MAAQPPPFANDGSFLERFKDMQKGEQPSAASTDASEAAAEAPSPPAAEMKPDNPDFKPSTSFTGAREGLVFKTGENGTGYYKDAPLHLQHKQKAKPVALKSSSLVKGLQRRTAAGPDAKRQKKDDDSSKPSYLKEMDRYRSMACSADTKHDRPLVK
ncbi:hypothetical protein COO60DRAFT_1122039 [Scenedesmus sp. NREL 46B-D3]|nr:hypothetical protein COO60DRAFT_1122039 [Scenedesmus sp. NREL 46B-D3]